MINTEYDSIIQKVLQEKKRIASQSGYVTLWARWYKGKVPSFHQYYIYNGQKKIRRDRKSMKMAKQVCEDWASLLMNEKVKIVVHDNEKMEKLLMDMDFWNKANETVEKAFALSLAGLVLDVCGIEIEEDETTGEGVIKSMDNAYLDLSVHSAFTTIPITWERGRVTECAFVSENTDYTHVSCHLKGEDGNYIIVDYKEYKDKEPEEFTFNTNSKYPFFAIIHPRTTNNLEPDSDAPISIFANAIDTLKAIDTKYDSYDVEFMQGKKRTYVSSEMNKVDEQTGEIVKTFDPEDTIIYALPFQMNINGENKNLITSISDPLRTQEHSQAIQDELNYLSKQVGLGVDYYRFEKGRVMTATQVISEKSDTFRNMKKHEGILEKEIISLVKAIMNAGNEFTSDYHFDNPEEAEVTFDDSIIEDKATEKDNDRKDLEAGVMTKVEFRMKWYGEDKETALKNLKDSYGDVELVSRLDTFMPAFQAGAISAKQFVDNVYTELSQADKDELIEELSKGDSISMEDLVAGGNYVPPKKNEDDKTKKPKEEETK